MRKILVFSSNPGRARQKFINNLRLMNRRYDVNFCSNQDNFLSELERQVYSLAIVLVEHIDTPMHQVFAKLQRYYNDHKITYVIIAEKKLSSDDNIKKYIADADNLFDIDELSNKESLEMHVTNVVNHYYEKILADLNTSGNMNDKNELDNIVYKIYHQPYLAMNFLGMVAIDIKISSKHNKQYFDTLRKKIRRYDIFITMDDNHFLLMVLNCAKNSDVLLIMNRLQSIVEDIAKQHNEHNTFNIKYSKVRIKDLGYNEVLNLVKQVATRSNDASNKSEDLGQNSDKILTRAWVV